MSNELTNKAIPSELEHVAYISNTIIDMMEQATEHGVSKEAIILAVVSATCSAVEKAEGMQVEELLPSNFSIKVVVTDLNEVKLSS